MVIKRVKTNGCGAKGNLKLLQEGGKSYETKGPNTTTGPTKKGKGSHQKDED